ncbi:DNA cytosine methyltransferase [Rothia sp. CCM 9417]|uniref:DNA cytosine methyltransferase n=1 Tax=Rothia sp. CCM 9417 TaxID=3402657 RepID=UPI003AE8C040
MLAPSLIENKMKNKPKVLDLFSGCGGMSWGLDLAGFEIIGAVDEWETALKTFKLNHPGAKTFCGDIRDIETSKVLEELEMRQGDIDVIVGGPPCQGFSKNVVAKKRFIDDPRNQLFREFIRFVDELRPKVVVMENVAEIYNSYRGEVRKEISDLLESFGYSVGVKVLTAADYGIPQRRKRCIFIASLNGDPVFPEPTHYEYKSNQMENLFSLNEKYVSAWQAISDLPYLEPGQTKIFYEQDAVNDYQKWVRNNAKSFDNHFYNPPSDIQKARYEALEPGQAIKDLPEELRPKSGYSGAYGRLDFESISPTITRWVFHAGSGRYGHPQQYRTLTMREAARIQSFTDDFKFYGRKNEVAGQIGNAVPPKLMLVLGDEIHRLLQLCRGE